MNLHYITVHHQTTKWIDLQLKHINHYSSNHKLWCSFSQDLDISSHQHKYHFLNHKEHSTNENQSVDHWTGLDALASAVCNDSCVKDEDVLVFIDSDALPINNINNYIQSHLKDYDFCAVNRVENLGCLAPHPSFAFCRVAFWKFHQLSWSGNVEKNGHWQGDSGSNMFFYFEKNHIKWQRIHLDRKKSLFSDSLLYVVYDDIVYHHCAGSRGTFETRATPTYMLKKQNKDFFMNIYKQIDDFIIDDINSGYFLKPTTLNEKN